jgi:hypothetical protein
MSRHIGILSGQTIGRRAAGLILAVIMVVALLASSAAAQDQLVFHADFNADATGVALPPSFDPLAVPDVNHDQILLFNATINGNSIQVQPPPGGGFATKSLRIANPRGFGSFPGAEFHPVSGSYGTGFYTVSWDSSVEQLSRFSAVALLSPEGTTAFMVHYAVDAAMNPRMAVNGMLTSIPYAVNMPQSFRAVVRMDKKTFDLYVGETRVACGAQFMNPSFSAISHLAAAIPVGPPNPNPEAMAVDEVRIVRNATTNTPPVFTPFTPAPPYTVNEGEPLTFTVNATDCDGDALTFSILNLPLGAIFDSNTRTLSWTPNSAQGGGQYYPIVQVTDGIATTSTEVTIAVGDTVADADGDGVPDVFHPTLGGPDNCPDVPNPGQFHVNDPFSTNPIGDACNNANRSQTSITAATDKATYNLGEPVTATIGVTFNITTTDPASGTDCFLIRTLDGTSVHMEELLSDGVPVKRDQAVHPGGPLAVSSLATVCRGTPATFSTTIRVNGPEAPYISLPAGHTYVAKFSYHTLDVHHPDVNPDGSCPPGAEGPPFCPPIFQVETVEATAQFNVIDLDQALREADALCDYIQRTTIDPTTKKDLVGKCRAIRDKIVRKDIGSACNNCNTFISAVQNYRSKNKISVTDANFMLDKASLIKKLLGCP